VAITTSFTVSGMTCEHCVNAVSAELSAVAGVTTVTVDLIADGASTVTVTSERLLPHDQVRAAINEAGDYTLIR